MRIAGGRDPGAIAQRLGEVLAAFELRRGLRRPEHCDPRGAQRIAEPVDQRRLGTDHHQADAPVVAERDDGTVIGDIERDELGMVGDPRIPRRGVEFAAIGDQARLRELPRQRMLATARSQQQDVHARLVFR